ncbi:MAG TPA: hypothetical protein VER33_12255 [Polyangiaceae bacterium]|nr:hypothetical protein [Polyangiaceae bacterium]
MANKGKPSKQEPDQRAEIQKEQASPGAARTTHRTDRSRDMEKGGKGPDAGLNSHGPTLRHPSESNKLPRSKINH